MARACSICGSRKWRKDKVTGNAICEDGHVQQDYRAETQDLEIGGPRHQLTRRKAARIGPRRNKRRDEGRANPNFYHGSEAEYLRIQALQLLLRLQVQAISKLWSLPDAFEVIVRDLWACQLSLSSLPPLPDSSMHSRPSSPSPPPVTTKHGQSSQLDIETVDSHSGSENEKYDSVSESGKEEGSESESDRETDIDVDPEILEQIEGSDKEEERLHDVDDAENNHTMTGGKDKWKTRRKKKLKISDTVITVVMGLWILRIPIIGVDIENAINEMKIPYIDFYHTTYLSEEMKRHINRDIMISLSPLRSPSPLHIHRSCKSFSRILDKRYGIHIPEINVHPVIWRIVSSLGGTPTTYVQVARLLTMLDTNLSLTEREINTFWRKDRSKPKLYQSDDDSDDLHDKRKMEIYERTALYQDVLAPEVAVVSAWIMIMKMIYGLDGIPRQAILKSDPAIGLATSKKWVDELKDRLDNGVFKGNKKDLERHNFNAMDNEDIDAFLVKAEKVLIDHRTEPNDVTPFPLPNPLKLTDPLIIPNSWANFHSTLQPSNLIAHTPIQANLGINKFLPLMPGEKVLSFPSNDPTVDLPSDFEVILSAGSEIIGWDKKEVLIAVEVLEKRLEKLRPRDQRGRKGVVASDNEMWESKSVTADSSRSRSRSRSRPVTHRAVSRESIRSRTNMRSREQSVSRTQSRESSLSRTQSEDKNKNRETSLNRTLRSREPSLSRTASVNRTNSLRGNLRNQGGTGGGMKNSKSFS
ncbi:uncharacterized protein IL334_004266 [Kwoniella shivajii]|uniref:RRN7-type domain-containing protein n=1 Tax=Kwoniella shivajii TaxID=564305 RepID=A0ABZ1CZV6_9TREE|nr:hypothetical protein IL334_004266 [Kwoniella shivajii]